jgi:hypothetical protein
MTLRKKRIYLTIIALSAVGLIVDRLAMPATGLAGPPGGPARRDASRAPVPAVPPAMDSTAFAAAGTLAAARFPESLREAEPPSRDIFGPSETARRSLIGQQPGGDSQIEGMTLPPEQARLLAERFPLAHVLSAVVNDGEFAVAILDGIWFRVGAQIDGCTLARIEGRSAFFDCGGAAVELSVGATEGPD